MSWGSSATTWQPSLPQASLMAPFTPWPAASFQKSVATRLALCRLTAHCTTKGAVWLDSIRVLYRLRLPTRTDPTPPPLRSSTFFSTASGWIASVGAEYEVRMTGTLSTSRSLRAPVTAASASPLL